MTTTAILPAIEGARADFLRDLEQLVAIDSGSYSKPGVDAVAAWMAERLAGLGASIERYADGELGDTIVADFAGPSDRPTVLLIGHADTVFEDGTAAARPFRIEGDRAFGPGVSDMKGGLLVALYAIRALREVAGDAAVWLPVGRLLYVVNSDEEIGSPTSTPLIRQLAASADVALVLESARANGDIVSARKGMLHLRATITGRAAHAGVEPEKGRNALLEAAHKTVALHELNGRWDGVSVNVGALHGGTRPNIVPAEAVLTLDMRARTHDELDAAESAIRAILSSSAVPDTTTAVEVLAHSRPMEKSDAAGRLVERAVRVAAELGFELRDAATGGGSDANTTAAEGVPSIDGLGPVGGSDHSPLEYIELDSIVPRTALLAELLVSLGRDPLGAR